MYLYITIRGCFSMAGTIYTVTKMAEMLGVTNTKSNAPSAVKLNLIMQDLGIQTKVNGKWQPTEKYRKYAVLRENENILYYQWNDELLLVLIKGLGKLVADRY